MDVSAWLRNLGLGRYEQAFRANEIDAEMLPKLSAEDLTILGVTPLGHRRKLLEAIAALNARAESTDASAAAATKFKHVHHTGEPEGERRQLTVMFTDLVGSTALSTRLDPEDMRDTIRSYQETVAGAVSRFEGVVAKFMGDGVLAYFGYPRAHEDDAERAVRAGIAIVEAVERLCLPDGAPLAARVGIATGLVVVGDVLGSGSAREREVIGETPNLAARLQALADPSAVVIAPATHRLVSGLFEYADLGERRIKGFSEPIRTWRVLGFSRAESRFEAAHAGSLAPIIGREQEIALLLDRWQRTKDGEGQVVLLSGEPGIGKSRVVKALSEHLHDEPHNLLRYFCSPHFTDTALHPVIDQLERAADLDRDDPPTRKLDKIATLLAESTDDFTEAVPLVAALLSIPPDDRYSLPAMAPQRQKQKTLTVLVTLLAGLAARRPVLVIWEDLHWSDPTSRELLDLIIERAQSLPVLIMITFRPEFVAPWSRHGHVTALTLARLGRRQAAAIVQTLTGGKSLPAAVLDQVLVKTDGVPLFVEELTKTVLEAGLLKDEGDRYALSKPLLLLAIPTTLQDSLMARLDRLAPAKEVAQIGAAIGREFSYELLAAVAPLSEDELREALDQLSRSELVFCRGTPPEATYIFKHALVREVAHATLLRSRRHQIHARIAQTLEQRFPESVASTPELLAHHWAEGGSTMRAIELWTAAGERALARAANREASGFFERALAALEGIERTPDVLVRLVELHRSHYNALYKFGELRGTRIALAEAERLAEELNDPARLCRVLGDQAYILGSTGDVAGAIRTSERAIGIADRSADFEGRISNRLMLARSLYAKGWYRDAVGHLRPTIDMLGEDVSRGQQGPGMNQTFSARVWQLLCCAELGEFPEATALADVAQRVSAQVEGGREYEGQVWLRLAIGRLAVLQNDFAKAVETLEPALSPCESEFVIYFSRVASSLGLAYARSGRVSQAVELLRQAVSQDQTIGFQFRFGMLLAQLGEVLLLAGDADAALDAGIQALQMARGAGEEASEAWARWLLGDAKAALGRADAAEQYRKAMEIAEPLGMAPLKARCRQSMRLI